MHRILVKTVPSVFCSILALVVAAWASDDNGPEPRVSFQRPSSAVFSDTESVYLVAVTGRAARGSAVAWRYSANNRTLARGESPVAPQPDGSLLSKISVRSPSVRDGIVFETRLTASLVGGGYQGEIVQPVWVFPKDPLADRQQPLAESDLHVYDPESDTVECLEDIGISFQRITGAGGLNNLECGLLIVGDRIPLARHPTLSRTVFEFAARGGRVLWLAPADGVLPFPAGEAELPLVQSLSFAREQVIAELDKRLDADAFRAVPSDAARFEIRSRQGRVVLETTGGDHGWPWIDMEYAGGGRLLICGFPLVRSWNHGPTPRYLFVRLLESLSAFPIPSEEN